MKTDKIYKYPRWLLDDYYFQLGYFLNNPYPVMTYNIAKIPVHLESLLIYMSTLFFDFSVEIERYGHELIIRTDHVTSMEQLIIEYGPLIKKLSESNLLMLTENESMCLTLIS